MRALGGTGGLVGTATSSLGGVTTATASIVGSMLVTVYAVTAHPGEGLRVPVCEC